MDIVSRTTLQAVMLDAVARSALGVATCGVSVGGGRSRIHLMNDNLPEQQRASDVLNHFGSLAVSADLAAMVAGDANPIVSCRDEMAASDSKLAYLALRGEDVILKGTLDQVDGAFALTLTALEAGIHDVLLYRLTGNFASGLAQIRVDAT